MDIFGGIATLGAGFLGAKATKDASKIQAQSDAAARQLQEQMYSQNREDMIKAQESAAYNLNIGQANAAQVYQGLPQLYQNINAPSFQRQQELSSNQFQGLRDIYKGYGDIGNVISRGYQQGIGTIRGTQGQVAGTLGEAYGQATGALQGVAGQDFSQTLRDTEATRAQALSQAQQYGMGGVQGAAGVQGLTQQQIVGMGQPYTSTGAQAMNMYTQAAMDPYSSPLFTEKVRKGQEVLQEQLAGMGLQGSGAALESTSKMYQELANQEGDLAQERLYNLAGMGAQQTALQQQLAGQLGGQQMQNVYGAGAQMGALAGQYGTGQASDIAQFGALGSEQDRQIAQNLAQVYGQYGNQLAGYQSQLGQNVAGLQQGKAAAQGAIQEQQLKGEAASLADFYTRGADITEADRLSQLQGTTTAQQNLANLYSQTGTNLANMLMGGSQNMASLGQNYSNQAASLMSQSGNTQAAAKLAMASGVGQTLTNLASIYGQSKQAEADKAYRTELLNILKG